MPLVGRALLAAIYPPLAAVFNQPPSPEALFANKAENATLSAPTHGGAADKVDLLDKHTSEMTGQQPGVHPLNPVAALPASPHLPMGTH